MATFEIVEGAPGQGKSLYTARRVSQLIKRNKKYFERQKEEYDKALAAWEYSKKQGKHFSFLKGEVFDEDLYEKENPRPEYPKKRVVASNMKFAEFYEQRHEGWISYWTDMEQLVKLRDVDVVWDEIATELDARNWANLTDEAKRFLSQYRKRGIDIYANTQDFSMIDARARLMITTVKTLNKVAGSADLSTTKPKPKRIWGLVLIREVENFKVTDVTKKKYSLMGFSFMFIEKDLVEIYDTRQDIEVGKWPPLKHSVRNCPDCGMEKVIHS